MSTRAPRTVLVMHPFCQRPAPVAAAACSAIESGLVHASARRVACTTSDSMVWDARRRRRKSASGGAVAHGSAEKGKETPHVFPLGSDRMRTYASVNCRARGRSTTGGSSCLSSFPSSLRKQLSENPRSSRTPAAVRELATHPAWLRLKDAAVALQAAPGQGRLGARGWRTSRPRRAHRRHSSTRSPSSPRSSRTTRAYLDALAADFRRWSDEGLGVPDFLDSLNAFQPQQHRVDGLGHLVVFPMYTQNGSTNRLVEAVLVEVIWPEFIAELEAGDYGNKLFVPHPVRRLHARLRHQLGRAVPGDRGDARDPDLHLGRDLPGPRGGALPARGAGGGRDHEARAARRCGARCSTTSAHGGDLRDVGPHPRPQPHARRPAVRPVHDQAADAVLPLLARGAALRPDGVPRVGAAGARAAAAAAGCGADGCAARRSATTPTWCSTR